MDSEVCWSKEWCEDFVVVVWFGVGFYLFV